MWQRQRSMGGFGHLTGAHASVDSTEVGLELSEELDALQQQLRLAEVSKGAAPVVKLQPISVYCFVTIVKMTECYKHCQAGCCCSNE